MCCARWIINLHLAFLRTLYQLALPWANARQNRIIEKRKTKKGKSQKKDDHLDSFEEFLKSTAGSIIH
jgi:hypothetical protein